MEPIFFWFIVAGLGIFTPLLITAVLILKKEGALFQPGFWISRLRFKQLNTRDWLWSLGAIIQLGFLVLG